MSTQNIKAGEAWWEITARDEATKVIERVAERLKSVGKSTALAGAAMTAAGTAVVAPVLAAAKSFSDYVDGLNDTRVQTGFAVESLSTLSFVAEQQGASLDGLKKGLVGMAKFTTQVASGGKGAKKVLDALGISTSQFMSMTPEERFRALAEQVSKISDPTLRAGVAMKVFGKSGAELLPMLALGAKGIADMQQRAAELGLTISQADADKFGSFGDELAAIGQQARRAWWGLGAAMIEAFTPFIPVVQRAMKTVIEFVDRNRPLVAIVLAGAAALMIFGAAVSSAGFVIIGVGAAVSAVGSVLSFTWTVFAAVANVATISSTILGGAMGFLGTMTSFASAALAALLSPLGLVVLAIVAVVAVCGAALVAWLQLTESGQRASSAIAAGFWEMWSILKQVFGGIWDALSSGEWGLAADIGFKAVGLAWSIMVAGMSDAWWGFLGLMGSALIVSLQFVDGAIRTVLNGLIAAYNWAAEKMGWATASAIADGSKLLADMQSGLDKFVADKSRANWADVAKTRKELDALTKRAADVRKARDDAMKISTPDTPDFGQPDLSKLNSSKSGKGEGGGVLGTFNAAVAGMLSSSVPDHLSTIAENTKETNEKLDELIDKADDAGLAWE